MLAALSTFFYRIASWKTLLLGVVLYVPFPAYFLTSLAQRTNDLAGQPIGPIDLLVGYDPARIQQLVAAYGPEGRAIYARGELTIDLAYPLIYTFLLCLILSLVYRNRPYVPFGRVNVLPVGVFLADLLENGCIVYLLRSYPAASWRVASLCSVLTNLKWAGAGLVLGLILYGLLRLAMGDRWRPATQDS